MTDKLEILDRFISSKKQEPFKWGRNDCALFCADFVLDMTGIDYAAKVRGRYSTALGSARLLSREETTLEEQVTIAIGAPVAPGRLMRGDIGLFDAGEGDTLGVCVGDKLAAPAAHGIGFVSMKYCKKGWHLWHR